MIIGIIGAGASGMAAALAAAENPNVQVVLMERQARVGRNPKTRQAVQIPPSRVPDFKASQNLKEIVK